MVLQDSSIEECLSAARVNLKMYEEDLANMEDPSGSLYLLKFAQLSIEQAITAHKNKYNITQK